MPDETIAFTMINGMVGRLYLSGHLDRMSPHERDLVHQAVAVYKRIRDELAAAEPFWPSGLPGWSDEVISLGLRTGGTRRLAIWWRGGQPADIHLDLPQLRDCQLSIHPEYPTTMADWRPRWDARTGRLTVTPAAPGPSARLLRLETAT